jgi:hypothetical protein
MAHQFPLCIQNLPESSETHEKFSARAAAGKLTKDDFKHFLAYLYRGETPTALKDLIPIAVEETERGSGLEDGKHVLYSFNEDDAEIILHRWYSKEEIGMYGIGYSYPIILNKTERHRQARLDLSERFNKSGKDVEEAHRNVERVLRECRGKGEGKGSQVIQAMAAVAFWWLFM